MKFSISEKIDWNRGTDQTDKVSKFNFLYWRLIILRELPVVMSFKKPKGNL